MKNRICVMMSDGTLIKITYADTWDINDSGYLTLLDEFQNKVAIFAHGKWTAVGFVEALKQ